jgi:hypothetical protein
MGENLIPIVEWKMIPQLPNQPLTSKTFCLQNFYNFTCILFSFLESQDCRRFVNLIADAKDIQNENSKMEIKMYCLSSLRGQIIHCMLMGGLLLAYPHDH